MLKAEEKVTTKKPELSSQASWTTDGIRERFSHQALTETEAAQQGKHPFVVTFDYRQGAVSCLIYARSRDEVTSLYGGSGFFVTDAEETTASNEMVRNLKRYSAYDIDQPDLLPFKDQTESEGAK